MSTTAAAPRLSVILPTYQGQEWILECLDSLAQQTLAPSLYEVVVIANGPHTGTPERVRAWEKEHAAIRLQLIVEERAGVSYARNVGLDAARGEYVVFVDDDDRVGPRMLETLLTAVRPGVVPVAPLALIEGDSKDVEYLNWYTEPLLPYVGRGADNASLYPALACVPAKLVETDLARRVRFRENLRVGEDRVFWMEVFAAEPLQIVLAEWSADAAYLYHQRTASAMDRDAVVTWESMVLPWIEVAAAFGETELRRRQDRKLYEYACGFAYGNFLRRFVLEHPAEGARLARELAGRGLMQAPLHWRPAFAQTAGEVVFVGLRNVSASAAAQTFARIAAGSTLPVDVLLDDGSAGHSGSYGDELGRLGLPLDALLPLDTPERVRWPDFAALAGRVKSELEKQEAAKFNPGPYSSARSVSAAPLEHLLAALFKLARPGARWTAEVLRPARHQQLPGAGSLVEGDALFQVLGAGLLEAGHRVDEVPEQLERFAELVTLGLADRLVFANAEHAAEVLDRCPIPEIAARAAAISSFADQAEEAVA